MLADLGYLGTAATTGAVTRGPQLKDVQRAGYQATTSARATVERTIPRPHSATETVTDWTAEEFGSRWCVAASFAGVVLVHLVSRIAPWH